MKLFGTIAFVLVLLGGGVMSASANHWLAPFEYLNGTAPGGLVECAPEELPKVGPCQMFLDISARMVYVTHHNAQGEIAYVARFRRVGREGLELEAIEFPPNTSFKATRASP